MPVPAHNFLGSFSPSPEPNLELKNYFALDDQGNALGGATCYLYQRGTESQASGMQKANGVAMLNPMTADEHGLIQFAAPNGLYDLRVVKGSRDYRIHLQFNDVTENVLAAQQAAERAEVAGDLALLKSGAYGSIEEGMLETADGKLFQVLSPTNMEYLILYRNVAGAAVEQRRYPSALAIDAVSSLISGDQNNSLFLNLNDAEGGVLGDISTKGLSILGLEIHQSDDFSGIYDDDGAVILHSDKDRILLGGLEIKPSSYPGIALVDEENCLVADLSVPAGASSLEQADPFERGLLFEPLIATSPGGAAKIYAQGLLPRRELAPYVVTSLSSVVNEVSDTAPVLPVDAVRLGATATLNMRPLNNPDSRRLMTLTLKNVPVQSPPVAKNILAIGDSILNYSGPLLLGQYLTELGINANWIGTLKSSVSTELNADGPVSEGRSGWETGDFTYAITDRAYIVEPGQESVYQALDKVQKVRYNPFLRLAIPSDDPALVRNGYIFDCAFYQSRFNLPTPDVVIQALGTNDTRDRTAESIYNHVYENDLIIYRQIKAAWPNAKIIRTLPGTATTSERNALWTSHYVPLIRAIQAARTEYNDSKLCIAPLWAMTATDSGYFVTVSRPVGADGFREGSWDDSIHIYDSTRRGYYKTLAPFVAGSLLNII